MFDFSLSYNEIGDVGSEFIARALESNTGIHHLEYVVFIYSMKEKTNPPPNLSVSWNEIGDLGCHYISGALRKNSTISSLMSVF